MREGVREKFKFDSKNNNAIKCGWKKVMEI
jgi:hypothetical protein